MSLKDMARTGRDVVWTRRGVDEFGGGFLGLFLMKLVEKSEAKLAREKGAKEEPRDLFDKLLTLFD